MSDGIANVDVSEAAVERLANRLHDKMEHLDPTEDGEWACLPDRKREFYRLCVEDLLLVGDADIQIVLGRPVTPKA